MHAWVVCLRTPPAHQAALLGGWVGRGMQVCYEDLAVGSVDTISATGHATHAHAHELACLSGDHIGAPLTAAAALLLGTFNAVGTTTGRRMPSRRPLQVRLCVCVFRPGGFTTLPSSYHLQQGRSPRVKLL